MYGQIISKVSYVLAVNWCQNGCNIHTMLVYLKFVVFRSNVLVLEPLESWSALHLAGERKQHDVLPTPYLVVVDVPRVLFWPDERVSPRHLVNDGNRVRTLCPPRSPRDGSRPYPNFGVADVGVIRPERSHAFTLLISSALYCCYESLLWLLLCI